MTSIRTRAEAMKERALMTPVLQGRQRAEYVVCATLWLAALVYFWSWWLTPAHHVDPMGSVLLTLVLAWVTIIPAYFIIVFFRAEKPTGQLRLPARSRIAMVVTKAPSEPFAVVARTLAAMLMQNVPHDTWLADEDPSPTTLDWCREHGVQVSTRRGREDYHRQTWPRRTRCKEGNLAFFYDHYGYEDYDFVVQLDADHVPEQGYLFQMLRPFADPAVGYVSAPSICDQNAGESWSARGRLYAEASMHGSLQVGFNHGLSPLCIGSHYAVRTKALKSIGGLGPELAEDHSTTLMMNAHGWRGIHALDAIAHGDGPRTFADLITQEFQWSRSLMMILLQYSPSLIKRLPPRLKIQFLFSQLWYSLFSLFMALMFVMPIIALVRGRTFVDVSYPDFLLHFVPQSVLLILFAYRWRSTRTFRPVNARILSWEMTLFLFARWPWALVGALAAIRDWATGSFVDFRVTPKGTSEVDPLPFRVLAPYALLSLASILPVLAVSAEESSGFYIFATMNAAIYTLLLLVIIVQHARENTLGANKRFYRPALASALLALTALPFVGIMEHGRAGVQSLIWDTDGYVLFDNRFSVAGAGIGGRGLHRMVLNPHWHVSDTDN
ncbi:glycosyltransferase family 2 protein [Rhizobium sp. AB2/73]|uniref:glycosyltransferase family 2 protein n=1 Tax=Rhizobium sp. AB2/73 TaxID=2795216 RepID=UPI000DE02888|nr:glycosyltransferase family 2 protein [Rhizobium sp. AB2/73]QYA16672.1 glycosyltransferase [Rhizobium sp. AB2/73]UEQ84320.1 glycosyltransferase [Rhizobium sp. AB2/73]